MAHSWFQVVELTCPNCHRPYKANVWMIIDTSERPDLVEEARQETLHIAECPSCGFTGGMDSPFLLFQPGGNPVLLMFTAHQTSPEEIIDVTNFLTETLRDILGDAWQDSWRKQGFIVTYEQRSAAFALIRNA